MAECRTPRHTVASSARTDSLCRHDSRARREARVEVGDERRLATPRSMATEQGLARWTLRASTRAVRRDSSWVARSVPRTIKKKPDPVNHPEYEEEEDIKTFPPEGFTVWDKVVIQEGDLTVQASAPSSPPLSARRPRLA